MFGFLNVNKPQGITSHDVVNRVRKAAGLKQVGHAGTLDPMAEGVLPVAVGPACRLIRFLPSGKLYRAKFLLGRATDTDDVTGETIGGKSDSIPSADEIRAALASFSGEIEQVPPIYSAIQQNGVRLYELARQGKMPDQIKSRQVTIEELDILSIENETVEVRIKCSAGTYIRSIARDLGDMLGCGGCLSALVREQSGAFHINDALTLEEIAELASSKALAARLVSPPQAICQGSDIMHLQVEEACTQNLAMGRTIELAVGREPASNSDKRLESEGLLYLVTDGIAHLVMCKALPGDKLKPEVVIKHAAKTI